MTKIIEFGKIRYVYEYVCKGNTIKTKFTNIQALEIYKNSVESRFK